MRCAILTTLLAVASCAPGPTAAPVAARADCAGWAPIRLSPADVDALSGEGVAQVLAHNRFGAARCGWRP
jgi:hypothetical protein